MPAQPPPQCRSATTAQGPSIPPDQQAPETLPHRVQSAPSTGVGPVDSQGACSAVAGEFPAETQVAPNRQYGVQNCGSDPFDTGWCRLVQARFVVDAPVFARNPVFFSARTGLLGGTWSLAFGYACSIRPFPHSRVAPARFLHPCPRSGAGLARFLDFR